MSRFLANIVAEELDEFEGIHQVERVLPYESDLLQCTVEVPAGYLTDFASVPRLPLAYLLYGGKGKRPGALHDLLYHSRAVPRELADKVLREAMLACGYSAATAWVFYQAVRVGGQKRWDLPNVRQPAAVEVHCTWVRAQLAHFWRDAPDLPHTPGEPFAP